MQKKLIAVAIAGLSGAAFAQSNVTIYGTMDAGFENTRANGATLTAIGAVARDMNGRNRITTNSSNIGFKGAESLGNGLTAVFQIETQISADGAVNGSPTAVPNNFSNTSNSVWATRDTYMGIAGGFGTVAVGYLSTPHRTMAASFDVMPGATGAGASTLGLIGRINTGAVLNPLSVVSTTANNIGGTTSAGVSTVTALGYTTAGVSSTAGVTVAGAAAVAAGVANLGTVGPVVANSTTYLTRENAIAYITPTFNGFSGVIAYVPNEAKWANNNNTAGANTMNPSGWNLAANYANGPLKVGYSYLDVKDSALLSGVATSYGTSTRTFMDTSGTDVVTYTNRALLDGSQKTKAHLFAIGYTFNGATTVNFLWDSVKGTMGATPFAVAAGILSGSVEAKRNAWMLGVKHVMGNHEFAAQYSRAKSTDVSGITAAGLAALNGAGATAGSSGANAFAVRYGYNFSKRTQVYALYSQINNEANGNYDFGTGGAVSNAVGVNGTSRINAGADPRSFGVGMRHSF